MDTDDEPRDKDGTRPSPRRDEPDAHGQAALLLVESVLHALVESGALTVVNAIDAVRTAVEVKAEETDGTVDHSRGSLALLTGIALSLEAEGRR